MAFLFARKQNAKIKHNRQMIIFYVNFAENTNQTVSICKIEPQAA